MDDGPAAEIACRAVVLSGYVERLGVVSWQIEVDASLDAGWRKSTMYGGTWPSSTVHDGFPPN